MLSHLNSSHESSVSSSLVYWRSVCLDLVPGLLQVKYEPEGRRDRHGGWDVRYKRESKMQSCKAFGVFMILTNARIVTLPLR